MKIRLSKSFLRKNASSESIATIYVYTIHTDWKLVLDLYRHDQKAWYREDADGNPLWLTTSYQGTKGLLARSKLGNYYCVKSYF